MRRWRSRIPALAVALGLAVGAVPAADGAPPGFGSARDPARRAALLEAGASPTLGPANAPVTIVEFADFQCPYSARAAATLRRLYRHYPNQVRVIAKHYPLRIHPRAVLAHEAAEAAHAQGRYWDMRHRLFANQMRLSRADLERYARDLELDLAPYTEALDTRRLRLQVHRDVVAGRQLGVFATPTYFINGRLVAGSRSLDDFRALVDQALRDAGHVPEARTTDTRGPEPAPQIPQRSEHPGGPGALLDPAIRH